MNGEKINGKESDRRVLKVFPHIQSEENILGYPIIHRESNKLLPEPNTAPPSLPIAAL
jgi:hypothetical protein